jgi:hypothetical protein
MLSVLMFAAAVAGQMPNLAAPPAKPAAQAAPACEKTQITPAVLERERNAAPLARKLGDLPRYRLERTVLRMVEGCVKPVIIRYEGEPAPASRIDATRPEPITR